MQPVPGGDDSREVLLGFIRVHILHHAAEGPVYGLWLLAELEEHGYRLSPGTLYPILHALEARGLLASRTRLADGKLRKYYRITRAGRRALARMRGKLRELVAEVLPG